MKKYLLLLLFPVSVLAQDDLLNEIDTVSTEKSKVESAFKGLKIVNLESTKLAAKGDLYFNKNETKINQTIYKTIVDELIAIGIKTNTIKIIIKFKI